MGVFTTSWWVVNQPIVVVIFIYAFSCFRLVILPLLGLKPLSLHIVAYFYPTFGGVTLYGLCRYYCIYCFLIAEICSHVCIIFVWGPRVCRHEDYKRIGHAEILNFRT